MQNKVTYGANSNRRVDDNGYLHVTDCVLTAAQVNDYKGRELKDYQNLDVEPEKLYGVYRPLEEITKALETYNNLPLTDNHIAISAKLPSRDRWLGFVSGNAHVVGDELLNDVSIMVGKGIADIENADNNPESGKKELSCGYAYDLIKEEGMFNGTPYQFKMINLRGNHVALVKSGRVDGAQIADSNENLKDKPKMTKFSLVQTLARHFARDAKDEEKEKVMDNKSIMDSLREVAGKDAEGFEGKEAEKLKVLIDLIGLSNDEEEEPEKEKEKAKDSEAIAEKTTKEVAEGNKKAADEETEKEKEKAMDMALDSRIEAKVNERINLRNQTIALCQRAVGKLSDTILMDSNPENIINATLEAKGLPIKGKSMEAKVAMIETLAAQSHKPMHIATDSKHTSKPIPNLFNAMKGK
jgi:hypothetical protein